MIRSNVFCERFNITEAKLPKLLRDHHLFGKTFKKWFFICPNPCSHLWSDEVLTEFWGENYMERLEKS
jgi:hypothetical protein